MQPFLHFIIEEIKKGRRDVEKIKKEAAKRFSLKKMPKNSEIFQALPHYLKENPEIKKLFFRKPSRTASGVTPIAVMIKPQGSCPFSCVYCPSSKLAPKSYTGFEPASLRARSVNFDPSKQVEIRLKQYEVQGHPTDKCEVIVMGGTFLAMPKAYRRWFIKSIYDTLNGKISRHIAHAKRINENAKHRVVGLTIETRPDVCVPFIKEMLYYGTTRVELGVQHPDDRIYRIVKRGHTVRDVVEATKALKDNAFKIVYHLMLGLPGSDKKKDVEMFRLIFSDSRFQPDMLKIYPTLLLPGTELYEMWKRGEYNPYSTQDALDVLVEAYRYIPEYVRVMRIQRDIPVNLVSAGVEKSNLREMAERKAKSLFKVWEIRAREPKLSPPPEKFYIFRKDYEASGGKEVFLSAEDRDREYIYGFVRLRIKNIAMIRELHVYGRELPLGEKGGVQHRGIGKKLLKEAETIAKEEFGMDWIRVISGAGVRPYYFALGYKRDGFYVGKSLRR